MTLEIQEKTEGISFRVRVVPRASRNEFAGILDQALKLKIKAPPVEGAANAECVKFLAKALGVPKRDVAITAGQTGRQKTVFVAADRAGRPALKKKLLALAG